MLRSIVSVVVGVITGCVLILIVEMTGHALAAASGGLDFNGSQAIRAMPLTVKLAVILAWFAGAFGGGAIASLIARRWAPAAWVVAATICMLAGVSMLQIAPPLWMLAAAVAAPALGGFLAVRATRGQYGRPPDEPPKAGLL